MEPNLFQNVSEEKRADYLRDNACKVLGQQVYTKKLDVEQLKQSTKSLVAASVELRILTQQHKEANKAFKESQKSLKAVQAECISELEFGQSSEIGELYLMDDQKAGMMHTYDCLGNYISSRPLDQDERQLRINSKVG